MESVLENDNAAARKLTRTTIDGDVVDPWQIGVDTEVKPHDSRSLEIRLGLTILFFELRQTGVHVSKEEIVQFVTSDLEQHGHTAMQGYLTIVRHVVKPPPRRKSLGWFARMFTAPPSWTPPQPRWKWTSVSEVVLSDNDVLVIKGACCGA